MTPFVNKSTAVKSIKANYRSLEVISMCIRILHKFLVVTGIIIDVYIFVLNGNVYQSYCQSNIDKYLSVSPANCNKQFCQFTSF